MELDPLTATVSVNIARRDDIRQIAVRPNVLLDTLPAGFTLKNQSYDPESIFVSGAPAQLAAISDTLFTEPISLEGRQEGFVITVPVQLPGDDLFVMSGDNNVTVSIEIIPIIDSRQIDDILVAHIGLAGEYSVSIVPKAVSAIVTGPVVTVDALSVENIQVVVDLNGLAPGVYDQEPSISINQGELSVENVSLLPDVVNVEISSAAGRGARRRDLRQGNSAFATEVAPAYVPNAVELQTPCDRCAILTLIPIKSTDRPL